MFPAARGEHWATSFQGPSSAQVVGGGPGSGRGGHLSHKEDHRTLVGRAEAERGAMGLSGRVN